MEESWEDPLLPAPDGQNNRILKWVRPTKRVFQRVTLTDAVSTDSKRKLYEGYQLTNCTNDPKTLCMTMAVTKERVLEVLKNALEFVGKEMHINVVHHPSINEVQTFRRYGIERILLQSHMERFGEFLLNDGLTHIWAYHDLHDRQVHLNRSRIIDLIGKNRVKILKFARAHQIFNPSRLLTVENFNPEYHPHYGENSVEDFVKAIGAETDSQYESEWSNDDDEDN